MSRLAQLRRNPPDISYAVQKALVPLLRGTFWQLLRLRRPKALYLGRGVRFIYAGNLHLGQRVSIGANSYIETCAREKCRLGDNVTLRENAWVQCRSGLNSPGIRLLIENDTYVGPNAVIGVGGEVVIGSHSQIGAGLTLSAEEHASVAGDYTGGEVTRAGIHIGHHCWIGNNVTILDGVRIGDYCVVGAGAVVTKSLPSGAKAVGVPARIIKQL